MLHTVRLCRDLAGWFATVSDDFPGYPGASVQWETALESADQAMSVLDLAQDLAQRLDGEAFLSWRPKPGPSSSPSPRYGSPVAAGVPWVSHHYEAGRFLAVVQVRHDSDGHGVRLTDAQGHTEAAIYYSTRRVAFDVAEALVKVRYRAHRCGNACSGWVEDACVEEMLLQG